MRGLRPSRRDESSEEESDEGVEKGRFNSAELDIATASRLMLLQVLPLSRKHGPKNLFVCPHLLNYLEPIDSLISSLKEKLERGIPKINDVNINSFSIIEEAPISVSKWTKTSPFLLLCCDFYVVYSFELYS
jgi:hypothetical protein